ncbi:MAG: DUF4387 domain-containing protein [Oscillospiraceae bacterium]|nr:DUF4387 domain-containing protein [Oscillospiraceae bacterium]
MMKRKLTDIAGIIRSKNSGPYELTLDIMFSTRELYEKVRDANAIREDVVCDLYQITPDKIINIICFEPADAIKITIARPLCSGDPGETDVYGAQQHAPLLSLEVDI